MSFTLSRSFRAAHTLLNQPRLFPSRVLIPSARQPQQRRSYAGGFAPWAIQQQILWPIIGLNVAVFLAWKIADGGIQPGKPISERRKQLSLLASNFTISHARVFKEHRWWTMLTSAFSQQELYHIVGNMFSLYAFGTVLAFVHGVTPQHVGTLALGSALVGNLGYILQQRNKPTYAQVPAHGESAMHPRSFPARRFPARRATEREHRSCSNYS